MSEYQNVNRHALQMGRVLESRRRRLIAEKHKPVPLMQPWQWRIQITLCAVWLAAVIYFWVWWLQPSHNIGWFGYIFVSWILFWLTACPLYFIGIFLRGRVAHGDDLDWLHGARVAMVTTKTQSEPFSVVALTLEAMLQQDYPHDTWLADESPSRETIDWCAGHGVKISTREGRPDYQRPSWPRRRRCKEGNLAYFYDHYGYANYDFVVQLDADHLPSSYYLQEMLKPFVNSRIGYVSAPSICDKNAAQSWSARGRLFAEGTLHGLLQTGYNAGWAPMCIGSHYAVRTQALKEIGGLGPELAEDHSTSMIMNAHGWRGFHAFNAEAHGDGPQNFADMIVQEFQWSRSVVSILLSYTPQYLPRLPGHMKFQFLFAQFWYPLFSLTMLAMVMLPIMALIGEVNFVNVSYPDFLIHFMPAEMVLIGMGLTWKRNGWCRPHNVKVISWESALFALARWPWALAGSIAAVRDRVNGTCVDFRITPKGARTSGPLPFRVLVPYLTLAIGSTLPVLVMSRSQNNGGFYIFATVNAALDTALLITILFLHAKENCQPAALREWRFVTQAAATACAACLVASAAYFRAAEGIEALAWGDHGIKLTRSVYSASGAGKVQARRVSLNFDWTGGLNW